MKKVLALASVCVVIGGFSAKAEEPLRAEKPSVEKSHQWYLSFEPQTVVIHAESDVPEGYITSTIKALRQAGHVKFALKGTDPKEQIPAKDALWMRINVNDHEAEIAVAYDLPAKTLINVIGQLRDNNDIEKFRFAPPHKPEN